MNAFRLLFLAVVLVSSAYLAMGAMTPGVVQQQSREGLSSAARLESLLVAEMENSARERRVRAAERVAGDAELSRAMGAGENVERMFRQASNPLRENGTLRYDGLVLYGPSGTASVELAVPAPLTAAALANKARVTAVVSGGATRTTWFADQGTLYVAAAAPVRDSAGATLGVVVVVERYDDALVATRRSGSGVNSAFFVGFDIVASNIADDELERAAAAIVGRTTPSTLGAPGRSLLFEVAELTDHVEMLVPVRIAPEAEVDPASPPIGLLVAVEGPVVPRRLPAMLAAASAFDDGTSRLWLSVGIGLIFYILGLVFLDWSLGRDVGEVARRIRNNATENNPTQLTVSDAPSWLRPIVEAYNAHLEAHRTTRRQKQDTSAANLFRVDGTVPPRSNPASEDAALGSGAVPRSSAAVAPSTALFGADSDASSTGSGSAPLFRLDTGETLGAEQPAPPVEPDLMELDFRSTDSHATVPQTDEVAAHAVEVEPTHATETEGPASEAAGTEGALAAATEIEALDELYLEPGSGAVEAVAETDAAPEASGLPAATDSAAAEPGAVHHGTIMGLPSVASLFSSGAQRPVAASPPPRTDAPTALDELFSSAVAAVDGAESGDADKASAAAASGDSGEPTGAGVSDAWEVPSQRAPVLEAAPTSEESAGAEPSSGAAEPGAADSDESSEAPAAEPAAVEAAVDESAAVEADTPDEAVPDQSVATAEAAQSADTGAGAEPVTDEPPSAPAAAPADDAGSRRGAGGSGADRGVHPGCAVSRRIQPRGAEESEPAAHDDGCGVQARLRRRQRRIREAAGRVDSGLGRGGRDRPPGLRGGLDRRRARQLGDAARRDADPGVGRHAREHAVCGASGAHRGVRQPRGGGTGESARVRDGSARFARPALSRGAGSASRGDGRPRDTARGGRGAAEGDPVVVDGAGAVRGRSGG